VVLTGIEPHGPLLRVWASAEHGGSGGGPDRTDLSGTGPEQVAADLTPAAVAELGAVPGERLWFVVKAAEVTVLHR
jgi:molybdate transport system permease protein